MISSPLKEKRLVFKRRLKAARLRTIVKHRLRVICGMCSNSRICEDCKHPRRIELSVAGESSRQSKIKPLKRRVWPIVEPSSSFWYTIKPESSFISDRLTNFLAG